MELRKCHNKIEKRSRELSPADIVVNVMVSSSLPPLGRVAVTVIEYSVPSSRPVSVYIVSLPAMSGMLIEPVKHSVPVAE